MPNLKDFMTGAVLAMVLAIGTSATAQTQRPVASLQVKTQTSAPRYRYTRIYRQICVPAVVVNRVDVAPLAQSPARVQEDSAERVQTLPGTQPHSEDLVQSMPRIGEE